jgi:hypothetical protein
MAQTLVARLGGWGGKAFFNMNAVGAGLFINAVDIGAVDLSQGGAPQATRITSLSISAQMLTAGLTAGAPAICRWAIVTGAGDMAGILAQIIAGGASTTIQWNSPWGGQGEYTYGFGGGAGVGPALPGSAIVMAEGMIIANPIQPNVSGTPPAMYTWDDNDDAQGGPGTLIAPPGQWCQLLVMAPMYVPIAAAPALALSNVFLTIRGNQIPSPYSAASGLPQASFTHRN